MAAFVPNQRCENHETHGNHELRAVKAKTACFSSVDETVRLVIYDGSRTQLST